MRCFSSTSGFAASLCFALEMLFLEKMKRHLHKSYRLFILDIFFTWVDIFECFLSKKKKLDTFSWNLLLYYIITITFMIVFLCWNTREKKAECTKNDVKKPEPKKEWTRAKWDFWLYFVHFQVFDIIFHLFIFVFLRSNS